MMVAAIVIGLALAWFANGVVVGYLDAARKAKR